MTDLLPVLVEREGPLAEVASAWSGAGPATGSAWLVCAEGGGGKSAFLRACGAHIPRTRRLWGEADPISPPEPYLAITRAISGVAVEGLPGALGSRIVETIRAAAKGAPIAIVLDDLHYADDGTIAVAQRLALEARSQGWLVLLAFRPREGLPALHEMAAELVAHGRAARLDLAPLSREAVAEVASHLRGAPLPNEEAERIFADSGGNPWFVEALVRGDAALSAAHHRLQVRLTRIERDLPGSFSVLSALSAVTSPTPYAVVSKLCGGDSTKLRALLRGLRDGLILEEEDDRWRFRQELMRRAILEAMIPADRRDAHRSLAEALEGEGRPAELAMHYAAAADPRAGEWALRAAREARRMEAHGEAYAQLQRALGSELTPDARLEAYELAADEAAGLGRNHEPILLAERGLALATDRPAAAVRMAMLAAVTLHWRGCVEDALPFWERAESEADRLGGGPDAALMRAWRALCSVVSEDAPAALAMAAAARESGATSDISPAAAAVADLAVALAGLMAGNPRSSLPAANALERVREAGLVPWTMGLAAFASTALAALELDAADASVAELTAVLERRQVGIRLSNAAFMAFSAVQRGKLGAPAVPDPRGLPLPPRSGVASRLLATHALRELRGGSLAIAGDIVGRDWRSGDRPLACASLEIARLEYLSVIGSVELPDCASEIYAQRERAHAGRVCGEAAVHLARAGVAVVVPPWLAPDSQLRLYWDWAEGILNGEPARIRAAGELLDSLGCPYEAAVARIDAGDLADAYRRLRALDSTNLRERLAGRLRQAGTPVPRRTRSVIAADGLTETEREVCRLVSLGKRNREVADALGVSVRTVETHLANLYRKTGTPGRTALAGWWSAQRAAP